MEGSVKLWIFAAAIFTTVIQAVGPAAANDLGPAGRQETGAPYRIECEPGFYMVGFVGRSGAWFDRLAIACEDWNPQPSGPRNVKVTAQSAGNSGGGRPDRVFCPRGSVVNNFAARFTYDTNVLDDLSFDCVSMSPPYQLVEHEQYLTEEEGDGFVPTFAYRGCPDDGFARGIFGTSSRFIYTIGFICSPAPEPSRFDTRTSRNSGGVFTGPPSAGTKAKNAGGFGSQDTSIPIVPPSATEAPMELPPAGPSHGVKVPRGMLYDYPHIRDQSGEFGLLDWCREWGSNCGEPAAEEFCQTIDHGKRPHASSSSQFVDAGRFRETVIISSRAACTDNTCDAFASIVCTK